MQTVATNTLNWIKMSTVNSPAIGLINYGLEVTSKGKLVLYGGRVETSEACSWRKRSFSLYNQLWIMDLSLESPEFNYVNWIESRGGYSKIISLGNETLCILNEYFKNEMVIIDFDKLTSFDLQTVNKPEQVTRTAFGIVGNSSNFIIYGGVNHINSKISQITEINLVFQISFGFSAIPQGFEELGMPYYYIFLIVIMSVLVFFGTFYLVHRYIQGKSLERRLLKQLTEENIALENSRIQFEKSSLELNTNLKNLNVTATLVFPNSALYVPLYKRREMGVHFLEKRVIANGGFGTVSIGIIVSKITAMDYNDGEKLCVVKKSKKQIPMDVFLQELSIHEVFRNNKLFAKLICFSENPQTIVLKYYSLGALANFIHVDNPNSQCFRYEYNYNQVLRIAIRLSEAIGLMHDKGYIHNDIKPENVLLDEDDEDGLFPVLTDFGIVYVTELADVIKGINTVKINAATRTYASPERLSNMLNHQIIESTTKGDVYSFTLVLLEMVTRKFPWKKFEETFVINSGRPKIEEGRMPKELEELIYYGWAQDPKKRPSMNEMHNTTTSFDYP